MSNLENNTASLQALLDKINALPEAGSGGTNSGDVKTCEITIEHNTQSVLNPNPQIYISYSAFDSNEVLSDTIQLGYGETITINSIINSIITLTSVEVSFDVNANSGVLMDASLGGFKIFSPDENTSTIELTTYQDGGLEIV